MKKFFYLATALVALASCSSDEMVNDSSPNLKVNDGNAIVFKSSAKTITRADHYGASAAALLNNKFIVGGYKGAGTVTAGTTVFDHYNVNWVTTTAGTTQSNTSDWEYVGYNAAAPSGIAGNAQSVKYWDYSAAQYDFIAYSTSDATVKTGTETAGAGEVKVTKITPSTATTSAYTLEGDAAGLSKCYIADMITAYKDGTDTKHKYQDEVTFTFRALASKVRVALYETVPGYSVKDVVFYTDASTKGDGTVCLYKNGDDNLFYEAGTYKVYFPTIGKTNINETDYNKAHLSFTASTATGSTTTTKNFGTLTGSLSLGTMAGPEAKENNAKVYLGRSSADASYAGTYADRYYYTVIPNENGNVLNLKVDYTLLSTDGSGEVINVKGATAQVPAIYGAWKSGYAYTYIFKISDNTNGWTGTAGSTEPKGLFPITFDAVVQEAEDATQATITTVTTPTITTYQKGHNGTTNEYPAGDIYIQVMDNSTSPATLKINLKTDGISSLYTVASSNSKDKDGKVSESEIMDALNNVDSSSNPLNGWTLSSATLSYPTNIPGADGNSISVTEGEAAMFSATAGNTYAYVYKVSDAADTNIGVAVTLTTEPTNWSSEYFTDEACTTAVPTTFASGVYYHKRGVNHNTVYVVKIIKVV